MSFAGPRRRRLINVVKAASLAAFLIVFAEIAAAGHPVLAIWTTLALLCCLFVAGAAKATKG